MVIFMALYPVYTNYHKGLGLEQYGRHIGLFTGDVLFPNPWQYRMLSHWLIEGLYEIYTHTFGRFIDIESLIIQRLPADTADKFAQTRQLLGQLRTPGFISYNLIFVLFRFVQHLIIFWFAYSIYNKVLKSRWLAFFGVMVVSLLIGNSVNDSDLAFNTYFDLIFYLAAAYIILEKKNGWYIVPLAVLGALNRETSVLIPFMYFISQVNWQSAEIRKFKLSGLLPEKKVVLITIISYILFWGVFFALRFYYGWEEYQGIRGTSGKLDILKINLFSPVSIKSYFEMFGTFMLLPFLFLYRFKEVSYVLKVLFIALVPVWFAMHLSSAVAYQSRLFLVPAIVILLPGVFEIVRNNVLREAGVVREKRIQKVA